ncbi:LuxR family transcriptional regulator [Marinilabiliaceae bacterium JC017]|nr:LuxR family transcriptional regulator [Marinilabiliaceae bacterium JC017]
MKTQRKISVPLSIVFICFVFHFNLVKGNNQVDSTFINDLKELDRPLNCWIASARERIETAISADEPEELAEAYYDMGKVYAYADDPGRAIDYYSKALELFTRQGQRHRLAYCLSNIGSCFYDLESNGFAKDFFNRAHVIFSEYKDSLQLAILDNQLGLIAAAEGKDSLALALYQRSLHYMEQRGVLFGIVAGNNNLGILQTKKGNLDTAEVFLKRALKINKQLFRTWGKIEVYNNLGRLYFEKKRYNVANQYLDSARWLMRKTVFRKLLMENLAIRQKTQVALHKYELAYQTHLQHQYLQSRMINGAIREKVSAFKLFYELEEKEKTIAVLNSENNQLKGRKSATFGGFIILLLFITGLYLYQRRNADREASQHVSRLRTLEQELNFRKKEATSLALHLSKRNQSLRNLRSSLNQVKNGSGDGKQLNNVIKSMGPELKRGGELSELTTMLNNVHHEFFTKLSSNCPGLTENELKILGLIRMGLSTKEIASIKNTSPKAVEMSRYRVRKKLNLTKNSQLSEYLTQM